jgi:transposase InsO family protein
MCEVLKVSKSGYYRWLKSGPSKLWLENQKLSVLIQSIFDDSYGSYGSPRISEELRSMGYKVSRPRVSRLMKANHLFARRKKKFRVTTDSKHNYPVAPNLLNQNFR